MAYRTRLFGDKHPRHRAALQLAVEGSAEPSKLTKVGVLRAGAGVARYPGDGRDAEPLLLVAASQAAQNNAQGRAGFVSRIERGSSAANDELPSQL